jgi:DNA polymerase
VTALSPGRRLEYLEALGLQQWVRRAPAPAPAPAIAVRGGVERGGDAAWERLRADVAGCVRCGLHAGRTQTVFGVGDAAARWLVVGEAPGAEEDRRGEPFVGRAGRLLDEMLRAIGLARQQVFIANVLKCRPPGNRDPRPDEVAACLPYLAAQIAAIRPTLILAVGRIAAQNLLATDLALARLRGRLYAFGSPPTPLIVTYHPAYLLRSPADKARAWEDLKFARRSFLRLSAAAA